MNLLSHCCGYIKSCIHIRIVEIGVISDIAVVIFAPVVTSQR